MKLKTLFRVTCHGDTSCDDTRGVGLEVELSRIFKSEVSLNWLYYCTATNSISATIFQTFLRIQRTSSIVSYRVFQHVIS